MRLTIMRTHSIVSVVALLAFGCASTSPAASSSPAADRSSSVSKESGTQATHRDSAEDPLESMHKLVAVKGARIIDIALTDVDDRGMPNTWAQSMHSRLLHKVVRADQTWFRIRSQDEVESFIEEERSRPVAGQRYGEIRFILEESPSDAKLRVVVREFGCADAKTLAVVPAGRVGTNEAELHRLRTLVEAALRESAKLGFAAPFACERR